MSDESNEGLLTRYRSAALDEPSASLDRAVLGLARRRAARVRTARRGVALCAMLVVAIALVTVTHRPYAKKARQIAAGTDYGMQEGATREYLLTVSVIAPGAIDSR